MKLDIIFRNNTIQFSLKNQHDEILKDFSLNPLDTYPSLSEDEEGYALLPPLSFNKENLTCQTITDGKMQIINNSHFLDKFFAYYFRLVLFNKEVIFYLSFSRKSDKKRLHIFIKKDAMAVGFGEILNAMDFEKAVLKMENRPVSFSDIISFFKEEL